MRPLRRTERPPAHDAVNIGPWPRPGSRCQRRALFVCQDRRLSGRLACHQCLRAAGIEAQHPVPDHRQAHAAGSRGLAAGPAVGDHRKGRKPPRLIRILAPARCATQVIAQKVRSRLNSRSRRKPPLSSMVNHAQHRLGSPRRACVSEPQYNSGALGSAMCFVRVQGPVGVMVGSIGFGGNLAGGAPQFVKKFLCSGRERARISIRNPDRAAGNIEATCHLP